MRYIQLLIVLLTCSCTTRKIKEKPVLSFNEKIAIIESKFSVSKLDSLQKILIGTKLNNYQFIDVQGREINLEETEKPIFLEATASWCKPCKALTPALNEIVEKYHGQIEFVLLTHDTQEKAENFSKGLHPKIRLIPSRTKQNPNSLNKIDVNGFKQVFPFPTTYFIDKNKIITDIKIGGPVPQDDTEEEIRKVNEYNIQELSKSIQKII